MPTSTIRVPSLLLAAGYIVVSCSSWNNPFSPKGPTSEASPDDSVTAQRSTSCHLHGRIRDRVTRTADTTSYFPLNVELSGSMDTTIETRADGTYEVRVPCGRYMVLIGTDVNDQQNKASSKYVNNWDSVDIGDIDSLCRDIEISLAYRGLQGHIIDDDSNKVYGAKITVLEHENGIGQKGSHKDEYDETDRNGFFRTPGWYFYSLDSAQGISLIDTWVIKLEKSGYTTVCDTLVFPDSNYMYYDTVLMMHEMPELWFMVKDASGNHIPSRIQVQGTAERTSFTDSTRTVTDTIASLEVPYGSIKTRVLPLDANNKKRFLVVDSAFEALSDDTVLYVLNEDANAYPAPTTLTIDSVTDTKCYLRWTDSEENDFARYCIFYDTTSTVDTTDSMVAVDSSSSITRRTIVGLDRGKQCYFRIYIENDLGLYCVGSNIVKATTLDGIPTAVTLYGPANITETSTELRWSQCQERDFDRYLVYIDTTSTVDTTDSLLTYERTRSDTTYTVTGLSENTQYWFAVYVVDDDRLYSTASNSVTARAGNAPPPVVTQNAVSAISSSSMQVNWNVSSIADFSSYSVHYSTSSSVSDQSTLAGTVTDISTNSLNVEELDENTVYYFIVYVEDADGLTAGSNSRYATTANAAPDAVTLLAPESVTSTGATLRWRKSLESDFSGYRLYYSTSSSVDNNSTLAATITTVSDTDYTVTGLSENTQYWFAVYVVDDDGLYSEKSNVEVNYPVIVKAISRESSLIRLVWTQSKDAAFASYKLYRDESQTVSQFSTLLDVISDRSMTTFDDLSNDTTQDYTYRIYHCKDNGDCAWSNQIAVPHENHPPVILTNPVDMLDSLINGDVYVDTIEATDVDGDDLSFRLIRGEPWGFSSLDSISGEFSYTCVWGLHADTMDIDTIVMSVEDSEGAADTLTFAIRKFNAWKIPVYLSEGKYNTASAAVGDVIYVFGGKTGSAVLNTVEYIDPIRGERHTRTPMPTARWLADCAVHNGKVYVFGGYGESSLSIVERYDPTSDVWDTVSSMPASRHGHRSVTVGDKIYVLGGGGSSGYINSVWEFDPVMDSWATKASMPTSRELFGCAVLGNDIYVVGGKQSLSALESVEMYSTTGDTWHTKTSLQSHRRQLVAESVDGKIYAMGGSSGYPSYSSVWSVEEYDPVSNSWTYKSDMPHAEGNIQSMDASSVVVARSVYVVGGYRDGVRYSKVLRYDYYLDPPD